MAVGMHTRVVAQGRSNHAIAEALVLTVGAVEKHVQSIMSKLGLAQSAPAIVASWPS